MQQDYEKEEVEMPEFRFKDNRQTINLMLAKPGGILAIIVEQTRAATQNIDDLAGNENPFSSFYLKIYTDLL